MPNKRHTYQYDALGRRIAKVVDIDSLGPVETRYFYGGEGFQQVCEEQDAGGNTTATYVYGEYIDEVLTMQRDADSDGTPEDYFYLGDDLHNVMVITDSTGTVIERYEYGDYGQPVNPDPLSADYLKGIAGPTQTGSNPSTINNPYLFNSRRFDPETGLYWYRTRYLDPIAGRFTSRDTIGIWGDPAEFGNGYAYVGNNPWTMLDPFGLTSNNPGGAGGMHPKGLKQVIEVIKDLNSLGKGARRASEWRKHWNKYKRYKDALDKWEKSIKQLPRKVRKQALKGLKKARKNSKGHEEEMRQKWPDLMEILCGK